MRPVKPALEKDLRTLNEQECRVILKPFDFAKANYAKH